MDDPDAPRGTVTHWVLNDIPPGEGELGDNVPDGTIGISARNSFGRTGYGGPCPPPGDKPHRYRFNLHALDVPSLGLSGTVTREEVAAKMNAHVLQSAQLVGRYRRSSGGRG
jgi:Raf kinase inhibitor-like YbhB/YbcL family protein